MKNNLKQGYILALDQGTTSTRALIFNKKVEVVSKSQLEFEQYYPKENWVEHNPIEIWEKTKKTIIFALKQTNIKLEDIVSIGITNQRETTVIWNKLTGVPIYRALVWQDTRTNDICEKIKKTNWAKIIYQKTGLHINSYFSATKIKWILENVTEVKNNLENLAFGTIDSWLIWCLSGRKTHVTDITNASRTMLLNIHTGQWDDEILAYFGIPKEIMPKIKNNDEILAYTDPKLFGENNKISFPIAAAIGDQQSALIGQFCFDKGETKSTYGTGAFIITNIGNKPIYSKQGLLTTIAYKLNGIITYALEGSVFIAGSVIKYLRDVLRIIYSEKESELFIDLVKDEQKIYFVPAFTGLGAPHWNQKARGAIFGLSQNTKREHIIKAAVESIAYQVNDVVDILKKEIKNVKKIKVDGGATINNYLIQFQSDISSIEIERPFNLEVTVAGCAFLAGINVGFWKSFKEIRKLIGNKSKTFLPNVNINEHRREILLKNWKKAVERTKNWSD